MAKTGSLRSANWNTVSGGGTKRIPTRAQVIRAKRQAVGGRRKRCMRGKNCSAACIQAGMVCLVEFPEPVQQPLTGLRDYLMKRNQIKPGSIQDKRLTAALGKMSGVMEVTGEGKVSPKTGLAKPEVEWKRDAKRAERQALPWNEVQGLKKRRELLSEAEVQKEAMKALHKDALTRGLRLPRAELEMLYEVLPKNVQTSLAKTGRAENGKWFAGVDEEGKPIFSKTAGKERALAVLDMWFRQGGTDAYQGRGGRVWAPPDLDVEHIIPLSRGGIDAPSNWILARAGAQRKRQNEKLGSWIDRLPKNEKEYSNYLQAYAKGRRAKQAQKARAALVDPKNLSDQELFSKGGKALAELFRAENGGQSAGTFTKEWFGINASGGRKGNSGPPAPFAKGIGLIAKTKSLNEARAVANRMKTVWNDDWKKTGSISKQDAFQQMMSEMKSALSADQFNNLFAPAANAWAQSNGFL